MFQAEDGHHADSDHWPLRFTSASADSRQISRCHSQAHFDALLRASFLLQTLPVIACWYHVVRALFTVLLASCCVTSRGGHLVLYWQRIGGLADFGGAELPPNFTPCTCVLLFFTVNIPRVWHSAVRLFDHVAQEQLKQCHRLYTGWRWFGSWPQHPSMVLPQPACPSVQLQL